MPLKDIDIGHEVHPNTHDYTHLMHPEKHKDYSVFVQHGEALNGDVPLSAHIKYQDKDVGTFAAWIKDNKIIPVNVEIDQGHRNKGLGSILYESAFAHAKNKLGAVEASGGNHSSNAHNALKGLAARHGLSYSAEQINKEKGAFDDAYGPYNIVLKNDLSKMAIADISLGNKVSETTEHDVFDYSHVLTPKQVDEGYSLKVLHPKDAGSNAPYMSLLEHKDSPNHIGWVSGYQLGNGKLEPHSKIIEKYPKQHTGRGLGTALYEALYAHTKHHGITTISGGDHTEEAARVHRKLAQKHGMDYKPKSNLFDHAGHGEYKYILKSEIQEPIDDDVLLLFSHPDKLEQMMAFKLNSFKPYHILYAFKSGMDSDVKQQALNSPFVDKWLLNDLISLGNPEDLYFIIDHPKIDAHSLELLWNHIVKDNEKDFYPLIQKLAYKRDLPIFMQNEIFNQYPECVHGLVKNPNLSLGILNKIVADNKNYPKSVVYSLILNPKVNGEILTSIVKNYKNDPELAKLAAKNPSLPKATMIDLIKLNQITRSGYDQGFSEVVQGLFSNPSFTLS